MSKIINLHGKTTQPAASEDQLLGDLVDLLNGALPGDKRRTEIVDKNQVKSQSNRQDNVTDINKYRK